MFIILKEQKIQQQQQSFDLSGNPLDKDGKPLVIPTIPETDYDKVKLIGNQDARILAAVYEQFISDNSLTKQEIGKLEYLDNALGGADIAVNLKTGDASILQNDDAKTFNLQFPGGNNGKRR